jgi:hypothetical protein
LLKLLDLIRYPLYDYTYRSPLLSIQFLEGLPTMKLAIRIFALLIVLAGVASAALAPKSAPALASHQSATASLPAPGCGPHVPTCPTTPTSGN